MLTVDRNKIAPQRQSTLKVLKKWGNDGKFKVQTWHCGGPNMFGGYNYSKANVYILDTETITDRIQSKIYVCSDDTGNFTSIIKDL